MSVQSTQQPLCKELEIWKGFFPATDAYIKTVLDCARYWDNQNTGLRELFFFMCEATSSSLRADKGINDPRAPLNADLNSIRQSLYTLANNHGTFDPFLPTAYFKIRFDSKTGRHQMSIDLNYKGRVHLAKLNGLVKNVSPVLVCEKDKFTYRGKDTAPEHVYPQLAPLAERGEVIGAYYVTTRPDDGVLVTFVNQDELHQLKSLAETQDIHNQWPAKMLLKSAVNQAERDWYSQAMAPIKAEADPAERLTGTKELLAPFVELVREQADTMQKFAKVVAYAMTFFTDQNAAREEGESLLMLLASNPAMTKCKSFSVARALMAASKYGVSLSKTKEHTYTTVLKGAIHTLEVDLMYQGMRHIAFSGVTNTSQASVIKLNAELIYSKDRALFDPETNELLSNVVYGGSCCSLEGVQNSVSANFG